MCSWARTTGCSRWPARRSRTSTSRSSRSTLKPAPGPHALVRPRRPGAAGLVAQQGPRLLHVVARTATQDMLRWGLVAAGQDRACRAAGRDTPDGPLRWQILVRDDGVLPLRGALPTLIQWEGRHPAASMPASGLSAARAAAERPARHRARGAAAAAASTCQRRSPSARSSRHAARSGPLRSGGARLNGTRMTEELFREDATLLECEATVLVPTKPAWCSTARCSTRWAAARPVTPER
jgi:hypothetical protein